MQQLQAEVRELERGNEIPLAVDWSFEAGAPPAYHHY